MKPQHFIITRFSYRAKGVLKRVNGPDFPGSGNPLKTKHLEHRFRLFEMICLPSIQSQTNQNFSWILLIDAELREAYRKKLERLVKFRDDIHLHIYNPSERLERLSWLKPYIKNDPTHILSTNLDDDDALPKNYVQLMHDDLEAHNEQGALPPLKIFGATRIEQWDLHFLPKAPLGYKCPWHRTAKVSSCGFSLLSPLDKSGVCVLGLRHIYTDKYFDFSADSTDPNVKFFREGLAAFDWEPEEKSSLNADKLFYDVSEDSGPVLMSNHCINNETERLYELKETYQPVLGEASWPGIELNWDCAKKYSKYFKKNNSRIMFGKIKGMVKLLCVHSSGSPV